MACSYVKGMGHTQVLRDVAGQQLPQGSLGLPDVFPRRCSLGCSSWRLAAGRSMAAQDQHLQMLLSARAHAACSMHMQRGLASRQTRIAGRFVVHSR